MRSYSLRLALSDYLRTNPACVHLRETLANRAIDIDLNKICRLCCLSRGHPPHNQEASHVPHPEHTTSTYKRPTQTQAIGPQLASQPLARPPQTPNPRNKTATLPQGVPLLIPSQPQKDPRSATPPAPPSPTDLTDHSRWSFSARLDRLNNPEPPIIELLVLELMSSSKSPTPSAHQREELVAHVAGLKLARSFLEALEEELRARMNVANAGRAVKYVLTTQIPAMPERYQYSVSQESQIEWSEQVRRAAVADQIRLQELTALVTTWRQRVMASEKMLARMTAS